MADRTMESATSFTVDGEFDKLVVRRIMDMLPDPLTLRFINGIVNEDGTKQTLVCLTGPMTETNALEAKLKKAFGEKKVLATGGV